VVVGDVVGHGLRAAATMGQLRNACRAYALVEASPAEVMARLNRLVIRGGEEAMATALFLIFDRESGEVTYTSAGHPPALVVSAEEQHFLEGGRSMPIGATEGVPFKEDTVTIPPGSTLLLYTDGLVERRDVPLEDRLAQLRAAAGTAGGELLQLCDQVLEGVLGSREPDDDVAILAVRPEPASASRLYLTLPAEPEVLAPLRRRLHRFLHAVGAAEDEIYEITLTVSEAAGNCIEHAYGPKDATFEVEVWLDRTDVVACVRDSGSWRQPGGNQQPNAPGARGRGLRIIEGLMDDVEVSTAQGAGTVVRMRRRLMPRVAA
jgi:anti-sigma regulatory factor (Ser/Thr protein kinase)